MDPAHLNIILGGATTVITVVLGAIYRGQQEANKLQLVWMEMFKDVAVKHEPNGNHAHTHDKLDTDADKIGTNHGVMLRSHEVLKEVRDEMKDMNRNLVTRPCILPK